MRTVNRSFTFLLLSLVLLLALSNAYDISKYNPSDLRASNRQRLNTKLNGDPKRLIADRMETTYTSCSDGWNDVVFWMTVFYGDWYANRGSNTILYYFYMYGW
jgi:hypothetical protein